MGLNKVISGINSEGKKENLKFIILQHLVKNERNEATKFARHCTCQNESAL